MKFTRSSGLGSSKGRSGSISSRGTALSGAVQYRSEKPWSGSLQARRSSPIDEVSPPLDKFPVLWCRGRASDEATGHGPSVLFHETRRGTFWRL
jgi:hypothetical protein